MLHGWRRVWNRQRVAGFTPDAGQRRLTTHCAGPTCGCKCAGRKCTLLRQHRGPRLVEGRHAGRGGLVAQVERAADDADLVGRQVAAQALLHAMDVQHRLQLRAPERALRKGARVRRPRLPGDLGCRPCQRDPASQASSIAVWLHARPCDYRQLAMPCHLTQLFKPHPCASPRRTAALRPHAGGRTPVDRTGRCDTLTERRRRAVQHTAQRHGTARPERSRGAAARRARAHVARLSRLNRSCAGVRSLGRGGSGPAHRLLRAQDPVEQARERVRHRRRQHHERLHDPRAVCADRQPVPRTHRLRDDLACARAARA